MDFGETWDTTLIFTNFGQENLKTLTVSAEGQVWAGTYNWFGDGSIWFTTDLGETWAELGTPDVNGWPWIFALAFHPQGDLFAGLQSEGLFRYNFTTGQWTSLFTSGISPDDILFIGNNKVFVGVDYMPNDFGGIFFSEDNCQTFEWINSGLYGGGVETSINNLFHSPDNYIYAFGVGFYRSINPVFTGLDDQIIEESTQSSNYPNPFTNKTMIHWDNNKKNEYVFLFVSDAKGKSILNKKIKDIGNYLFQNDNFETGILYYSIVGNNKTFSGKMVLVK